MLGDLLKKGMHTEVDTGLFPNPRAEGATMRLRFRRITPTEASQAGQLVRASVAAAVALGDQVPEGLEALKTDDLTEETALKITNEARAQAALWCRGASIDGGKTWNDMALTLDESEQDVNNGPLWVDLFPATLWPLVVTQCWSSYTAALMRVGRFRHADLSNAGEDGGADGTAAV
ncbi:MAG: hypothetical protein ACI8RZ_004796 [Myxococcota bacterium]|jgi:hypothetical protein